MSDVSRLVLEVDSKGIVTANGNLDLFKKKAEDAKKAADQFEKFGSDLKANLFGSMTAANLAADGIRKLAQGCVDFVQSSLQASGQLEMIRANLTTVMGSASAAGDMFQQLKDFAARTPFEMPGITESAIMLKQSGVAAGDLISTLQMLGDAAGGSQEKLNRIALNYAQIMSVGKAATMDIKQFAMAGLPIYDSLAAATGRSTSEIAEMASNGEITKDVIIKAFQEMTSEGGTFFNGMALGAETLEGKISTLQDSWTSFRAEFADSSGLTEFTKTMAVSLTDILNDMTEKMENHRIAQAALMKQQAGEALTAKEQLALVNEELDRMATSKKSIAALPFLSMFGPLGSLITPVVANNFYKGVGVGDKDELESNVTALTHQVAIENMIEGLKKQANATQEKANENKDKAIEKEEKWQKVLKQTLDLEKVTSVKQAVSDYSSNLEASINGGIAYVQAFGGDVVDIYKEKANEIQNAIKNILEAGIRTVGDQTVVLLQQKLDKIKDTIKSYEGSFNNPLLNQPGVLPLGSDISPYSDFQSTLPTFGISKTSLFDDQASFVKKENPLWKYTKDTAKNAGLSAISGSDLGNFAEGAAQGGWQQGLINMVIQALMKVVGNLEPFERMINIVTESLQPLGSIISDVLEALYPLMDAIVLIGGASATLLNAFLKPLIPVLKILCVAIGGVALLFNEFAKFIDWLTMGMFGDLTDKLNAFADSIYESTDAEKKKKTETEELIEQLKELREQIKKDQLYYLEQGRALNASEENQSYSLSAVQDAIIAPGGRVITTAPDDYLIATKTPGALGGSGGQNVFITVSNTAGDVATASVEQETTADGALKLVVAVKKAVAGAIASGEFDSAFAQRDYANGGRRSGN